MKYRADDSRYDNMNYRRCGNSGLKLPELSLGLWHNFGRVDDLQTAKEMLTYSFGVNGREILISHKSIIPITVYCPTEFTNPYIQYILGEFKILTHMFLENVLNTVFVSKKGIYVTFTQIH